MSPRVRSACSTMTRWKGLAYAFARGAADVSEIHFLFEDIEKRKLKIVPAWKIGPDDFLRAVLLGVMNPVVQGGKEDPRFYRPATAVPCPPNSM